MLTFVDDVYNLDQEAKVGTYYLMILSVTTVEENKLTMNDGNSEFELAFETFGDYPKEGKHYYCLIDIQRNLLYMKELYDEPVKETVRQFMALCSKHSNVFN